MMHGCTEPSSTLHPYALAIAPHNMTDPIGANANARMMKSASACHNHGNFLPAFSFMTVILDLGLRVNIYGSAVRLLAYGVCWTIPCCSAQFQSAANSTGCFLCSKCAL